MCVCVCVCVCVCACVCVFACVAEPDDVVAARHSFLQTILSRDARKTLAPCFVFLTGYIVLFVSLDCEQSYTAPAQTEHCWLEVWRFFSTNDLLRVVGPFCLIYRLVRRVSPFVMCDILLYIRRVVIYSIYFLRISCEIKMCCRNSYLFVVPAMESFL